MSVNNIKTINFYKIKVHYTEDCDCEGGVIYDLVREKVKVRTLL